MKKTLLAICLAAASLTTFAQSGDSPVTFGIKGGVNFAKLIASSSSSSVSASTGTLTSFHAGVFADFKTSESISIQPGLYFTNLGGKTSMSEDGNSLSATTTLNYLQLPVDVVYNAPVSFGKFFVGAGPFIGYAISGKDKAKGTINGESGSVSEDVTFGEGAYKRTNFGINTLAGIQLENGLLFNVNYDFGLSNIIDVSAAKVKTSVFGISVGFAF